MLLLSPPSTTFLSTFFLAVSSPDCRSRSVSHLRSTVSWFRDDDALPRVPFILSNRNSFQGSPPNTFSFLHTFPVTTYTTLVCHTAYKLDEGSIVHFYHQRIMTQNLQETMPLGIQRSRSRLGELLAADTLVAAGSATLITPAVMIFDR